MAGSKNRLADISGERMIPMIEKMHRLKYIKRLRPYIKDNRRNLAMIFFIRILMIFPEMINIYLFRILIDNVILQARADLLWLVILAFIAMFILDYFLQFFLLHQSNKLSVHLQLTLRQDILNRILRTRVSTLYEADTAELKMNLVEDIDTVEQFIYSQIINYILYFIRGTIYFLILLNLNWYLTLILLITVPIYFLLTKRIKRFSEKVTERERAINSDYYNWLNNSLGGWKDLKTNAFLQKENKRLEELWSKKTEVSVHSSILWYLNRTIGLIKDFLIINVLLYTIGGLLILFRRFAIGQMIVFVNYFNNFFNCINSINDENMNLHSALPILERALKRLEHESFIDEKELDIGESIKLEADHVTFGYNAERGIVLHDVSLVMQGNEKVLLVGESGCGKSTLAKLLLNLYQTQQGQIRLNGMDINTILQEQYHRLIGAYLQDSVLLNLSIYENLAMANPSATREDIIQACKTADIHEYIESLPEKYDTIVDENATNMSGGQKQRIAIARLLIQNPRIVILDEATISLDPRTEKTVLKILSNQFADKIVLMISHRKEHEEYADRIVSIQSGTIVEV